MSDVFLLSGGEILPDAHGLRAWLERQRINPAWLDEIHYLSIDEAALIDFPIPQWRWSVAGPAAHRLLHLIVAEFQLGRKEMSVVMQCGTSGCYAMILGSPGALGRRNLLPEARINLLMLPNKEEPAALSDRVNSMRKDNEIDAALRILYTAENLSTTERQALVNQFPSIQCRTANNLIQSLVSMSINELSPGESGLFLEIINDSTVLVEKI